LPARLKTAAGATVNFETICSRHAVVGDSKVTVQALRDLSQKTGATHFLTWHNIGSIPHPLVKESMERFAREVMPQL
jgi:hypothetical protein